MKYKATGLQRHLIYTAVGSVLYILFYEKMALNDIRLTSYNNYNITHMHMIIDLFK